MLPATKPVQKPTKPLLTMADSQKQPPPISKRRRTSPVLKLPNSQTVPGKASPAKPVPVRKIAPNIDHVIPDRAGSILPLNGVQSDTIRSLQQEVCVLEKRLKQSKDNNHNLIKALSLARNPIVPPTVKVEEAQIVQPSKTDEEEETKSYSPPAKQLIAKQSETIPSVTVVAEVKDKAPVWDRTLYPVLKKHVNENFPQVTYHIPHSRSHNQKTVEYISQFHPCKLKDVHALTTDNEHPICAAMRAITEAWALRTLIQELKGHNVKNAKIMDVGGAASRHFSHKRDYVWSCVPKFDARDAIRAFNFLGKNHCSHKWQDCNCCAVGDDSGIAASISVHSLYYIEAADMLKMLLKQRRPVHYAIVHFYPDREGSIMESEMSYAKKEGKIWVKAAGNLTHYYHNDNEWMKNGHYSDENGTLEWDVARRFGDTYVLRFVAVTEIYPSPPTIVVEEKKLEETPVEQVVANDDLKFEEVVNASLDYGIEVTTKAYSNYLSKVKRKGLELKLNIKDLVTYASDRYMKQEEVVSKVSLDLEDVARRRSARLKLETNLNIPNWCIVLMVVSLSYLMFRRFDSLHDVTYIFSILINNAELFMFACMLGMAASFKLWSPKFRKCLRHTTHCLPTHHTNFLWCNKALVMDYCCQLPDRELDPTKCKSLKYPTDYGLECEAKPAAKAMIYHPKYPPYFPRKCLHNQVSCLRNKLLYKIPDAGIYKLGLHPILQAVARSMNGSLVPLEWDEWVERFPSAKEKRFRADEERNRGEPITRWNDSNLFPKFEAYSEPKYPRPIVSASVEFNFSTGRWLIPLAELLAKSLPSNIMFPLHGDSVEIGAFHDEHIEAEKYEGDFSAFDSSQRKQALMIIIEFMRLAGVPEDVLAREMQDLDLIKISTRSGLKALISAIRVSGRSATLIGNSIITINTNLHIFGENLKALLVKGDDSVTYLKKALADPSLIVKQFLDNGLVIKLRQVDKFEVEFCSSIFLPCAEGSVLVPKPGKLMAKTFWCKELHFDDIQIEQHFASIAKGLSKSISLVPGFNGILENPAYTNWFHTVEARYEQYNEYASVQYTQTQETIDFICQRYGLENSQLDDLHSELRGSFPIRLQSYAAEVMIEKDWGVTNDADHLREQEDEPPVFIEALSPLLEEIARFYFPLFFTLLFGCFESLYYRSPTNLIFHCIYLVVSQTFGPFMALFLHYLVNMAGPKTNFIRILMPRKQNKQLSPNLPKKKKGPTKKPRTRNRATTRPGSGALARMIADPCHAELMPGLYGSSEGILSRYKSNVVIGDPNVYGYIIWAPSYVGSNFEVGRSMNCIAFSSDNIGDKPLNTGGSPLGSSTTISGVALTVGASHFILDGSAQDFRTVSACIRMLYTGNTSDCKGRVAMLDNIPASMVLDGLPSVTDLFTLAPESHRTSLEMSEVSFRPSRESAKFKDKRSHLFLAAAGVTTISDATETDQPSLVGIVWSGIPSNQFSFDLIQNIEWRPKANLGYVEPPVKQITSAPVLEQAIKWLDDYIPNWSTRAFQIGARLAGVTANLALGGPPQSATVSRNLRIRY